MGALVPDGDDHDSRGSGDANSQPAAAPLVSAPSPPPPDDEAESPDQFIDPISQELMIDPVLLVETGQSYERSTLEAWFARCGEAGRPCTDPLTRTVLHSTTAVSNYSLKSLVASWAERHRIADLPTFSKQVARHRTLAHGGAAAAAEALARWELAGQPSDSGSDCDGADPRAGPPSGDDEASQGAAGVGSSGAVLYPALSANQRQQEQQQQQQSQQQPQSAQQRPQSAQPAGPGPASSFAPQPGALYPAEQDPRQAPLQSKPQQAEAALAALRAAATQQGSARGAAAYNAWAVMQLAGDAEGRALLWEGNAIPLAIFLLGLVERQQADERDGLAAAAPALCGVLQRLAARDAEAAASIVQCGGLQVLVAALSAPQGNLRAAACMALYFLGWQGAAVRSAMLEALSKHAAACNLPPRPLLAFWRMWEQPGGGSASAGDEGLSAAGRKAEWDSLALVVHMLAEGCSSAATALADGGDAAGAAAALDSLDASASAAPDALVYAAACSPDHAVRYAGFEAASILSTAVPANRGLLLAAALRAGQQAGTGAGGSGSSSVDSATAAGNLAWLLWLLCYRQDREASRPAAVRAVAQPALLAPLEAALTLEQQLQQEQQQGAHAACWHAAGLLTCLLHEPAARGDGSAATAADAARTLLSSAPAGGALQGLLALLQPTAAAALPQAAQAAALAVANLATYRGAAAAAPTARLARAEGGSGSGGSGAGSGNFGDWLSARASRIKLPHFNPALPSGPEEETASPAAAAAAPAAPAPTDPRGALLHFGAMHLLAALIASSCEAAAGSAAVPASLALTPGSRQQAAASAAVAAEQAAAQRAVLSAALLACQNLCSDPAAASQLRVYARPGSPLQQQLSAALNVAMGDRRLPEASRTYARLLLHTLSGAPGQRHAPACALLPPPRPPAAYPNP